MVVWALIAGFEMFERLHLHRNGILLIVEMLNIRMRKRWMEKPLHLANHFSALIAEST